MKILGDIGYIGKAHTKRVSVIYVCIYITEGLRIYIVKRLSAATLTYENTYINWDSIHTGGSNTLTVTEDFIVGMNKAVKIAKKLDSKYTREDGNENEGPICCNKRMKESGVAFVCSVCGGWNYSSS